MPDNQDNLARSESIVEDSKGHVPAVTVAIESSALKSVIKGRTVLCKYLVLAAITAVLAGAAIMITCIIVNGPNPDHAIQLIQYRDFKLSSSGFGAVFMSTGIILGWMAYLARPRFDLYPAGRSFSISVDGKKPKDVERFFLADFKKYLRWIVRSKRIDEKYDTDDDPDIDPDDDPEPPAGGSPASARRESSIRNSLSREKRSMNTVLPFTRK